VIPHQ